MGAWNWRNEVRDMLHREWFDDGFEGLPSDPKAALREYKEAWEAVCTLIADDATAIVFRVRGISCGNGP